MGILKIGCFPHIQQIFSILKKTKVTQKDKPERHEKAEKKPPPKEEKKVKSTKVEAKLKKEVKDGKGETKAVEKVKQAEIKPTETGLIKAKTKVKEEKALQTVTKSDKKDQYAFCRYVIDMFAQGDFYPGHKEFVPPRLLLEHSPRKKPAAVDEEKSIVVPRDVKKRKEEKKKTDEKRNRTETKMKAD
ncbi:triadin-like [Corapipo altera]|uniref:triadin-like n=1 Tax=Corapipo altera TaxID=415028 RepID=UPI000FD68669|nr:triadin-like [Corapipo altera]